MAGRVVHLSVYSTHNPMDLERSLRQFAEVWGPVYDIEIQFEMAEDGDCVRYAALAIARERQEQRAQITVSVPASDRLAIDAVADALGLIPVKVVGTKSESAPVGEADC